jgi:hypothetical protein
MIAEVAMRETREGFTGRSIVCNLRYAYDIILMAGSDKK